jgi:carboxyl-terminal processing protease
MQRRKACLTILSLVLALNALIGYRVFSKEAEKTGADEVFQHIDTFMEVMLQIRKNYVDIDKVDYQQLIRGAMTGMAAALDPYSAFLPPSEFNTLMEDTEGEFGGIGVTISIKDGALTVVSPIAGTPGARAGILSGDQITKIGQELLDNITVDKAAARLRGKPGSTVNITIYRPASNETIELNIERALIPLVSVADATVLKDSRIGYVRVTQFMEPTAGQLRQTLENFVHQDVAALIIDLRNNPGGLLDSAVDVCSFFLPPEQLVVSVEGRDSKKIERSRSGGFKFPADKPVLLLINGGSASAAEITAGCLSDTGRAILLGEKTFGKGSVQNVMQLQDGSALKLTIAKYYTPSRRIIHEHGIEPDIEDKLSPQDLIAIIKNEGDMDKLQEIDKQLKRAVEVLNSYLAFDSGKGAKFKKLRSEAAPAATPAP